MEQCLWLFLFLCYLFFQLPLVFSLKNLLYLDLGSNLLEGPLPPSICNLESIQVLVLSNNKLSGTIPECWGNFSSQLMTLDLKKNNFHGQIPRSFGQAVDLKNLGLNGNQLEGPLPRSLINCTNLEVIDIGYNNISGSFPMWLETLPELQVLILKSNRFSGSVGTSKTESPFQKLRILDLSYNEIEGLLPAGLLKNFRAMMSPPNKTESQYMGSGSYYLDSVTLVMKGQEMELKRVLTILTTIDFAGNKFEGVIPKTIGNLHSLCLLNLSHNNLDGQIPPDLGDLASLESLDLSGNQLEGEIPWQLTKLTFLGFFNISHNHLVGPIPQGKQFNTFSNDSFSGNLGLCEFPLKKCGEHKQVPQFPGTKSIYGFTANDLGLMNGFTWKSVVLGYGFGIIIGLIVGGLMFFTGKPRRFMTIVEEMCFHNQKKTQKKRRQELRRMHKFVM